jgi:type 1 glutamine amidotransferase
MKGITRRTAIWNTVALSASIASAREKATAFALIGDRYHNSDYIRTGLNKTLGKDLGVSIDFCDEVKMLDAETLRGYKLLIVFRDGMTWPDGYPDETSNAAFARLATQKIVSDPPLPKWEGKPFYWITPAQGKAVKEFVAGGGGVLFYHNVTYISPHNDDFRDVLGAVTQQHPPIRPFKVKVVNKEHPITRGVNDFIVTDEQHFMTYQKDPKYLLLQSVNEDGLSFRDLGTTSAAGWAYDYGKGRVCYLGPGHLLVDLWNPEYEKLQKNAIRWLLRQI